MKIISFEGIDACGKETQAEMLVHWLQEQNFNVLAESFPRYHEPIGQMIKDWLMGEIDLTDEAVHMLYEADRQDFMDTIKWLEHENTRHSMPVCDFIVLDRYKMSNLAFGAAKGIDPYWLSSLQMKVRNPDVTFILDISPSTSVERRTQGRDRHEQDLELLSKSRDCYLSIAQGQQNTVIINGELSVEEIHQQIKEVLLFKHFS